MASADRRPEPLEFRRAIICALPREFDAVEALFDEHYDNLPTNKHYGDPNFYRTGRIGTDYIVLTCLAEMGKGSAASAASALRISFPNIDSALVVGICGGVPFPTETSELILGDVVISHQVVKFDYGRQYPDRFEQKGSAFDTLDRSRRDIRSFLSGLQTRREKERFQEIHFRYLQSLEEQDPMWQYPGANLDRLFEPSSQHANFGASNKDKNCENAGCHSEDLVKRQRLTNSNRPKPLVHIGAIASGDTVMKSAEHRDTLARKSGIVGFEMEGAGVCNSLSCLIIKGACDYADSHKNKIWQDYAAASAAACAKALLECLTEHKSEYGAYIFFESLRTDTGTVSTSIVSESTRSTHDTDEHINEALRCLERGIPNNMMRRALVPSASDMTKRCRGAMQNLQKTKFFESKPRETMFGTLYFQTKVIERQTTIDDETGSQSETRTSFIFHPAPWLMRLGLRYGLKAMAINHHRTWQYSIRPVHSVPDDSLIFSFARRGNVDAVRELFIRREASVFDVDNTGWTPLHTAAFYGQFEMARFLILEGADKRAYTYGSITPASMLTYREDTTRPFDLLLLFEDCIEFSDSGSDGWRLLNMFGKYLPQDPQLSVECFSFLLQKYRAEGTGISFATYVSEAVLGAYTKKDNTSMQMIIQFDPSLDYYHPDDHDDAISAAEIGIMFYLHQDSYIQQYFIARGLDLVAEFGGETPMSRAIRFVYIFLPWRRETMDLTLNYNIDLVIQQETCYNCPLALQGWKSDTLFHMFHLAVSVHLSEKEESLVFGYISCVTGDCPVFEPAYHFNNNCTIVEPWWEEIKHRIKTRKCICLMRAWITDIRLPEHFTHTSDCPEHFKASSANLATNGGLSQPPDDDHNSSGNAGLENDEQRGPPAELCSRFEYYYVKHGGLRHTYAPHQYYCFNCLAQREGWELEPIIRHEEQRSATGGGFVTEVDDDSQTEGGSDPEDGAEPWDEFVSPKRGEKRKLEDAPDSGPDQLRGKRTHVQDAEGVTAMDES